MCEWNGFERIDAVFEGREAILAEKYRASGLLTEILKPGCDHHPHGLEDLAPLYAFAEKYYG